MNGFAKGFVVGALSGVVAVFGAALAHILYEDYVDAKISETREALGLNEQDDTIASDESGTETDTASADEQENNGNA